MNNQFDLISIGDASMDVFISPTESETLCLLDDKDCLICFSYGDKIPVKSLEYSVGGNAANNAVGVTRMGARVGLILTLGEDNIAVQIREKLEKEGVDLSYVTQEAGSASNYSTVVNYSGERTIFVYHAPRDYIFPTQLPRVTWVYLTSMGEGFEAFYQEVANWLNNNPETKLAFNPGSYQLRVERSVIQPILARSQAIFVNRKEAEKLTDFGESHGKDKELLKALNGIGPRTPIITDGGNGSIAYDGVRFFKAGILPVDAYERTGAGDAFGSGCLAAIIKGKSLEEALLWGTLNSASVIGYVGPQKGLLKEADLGEWMERAKSCDVKVEEF